MDSPDGLIVPNIKNVQDLTVLEIAAQMARLINLGESGKLGPNDVTGGTFSLSNIGSVSIHITAVIHPSILHSLYNPSLYLNYALRYPETDTRKPVIL